MYKVFIVDDEPNARYGLRDYFNWSQYGIEVIGEADDGESALEAMDGRMPDIVLTDVKMPNMDGIQLSEKLREKCENIKIVFISGHDDVNYLKSALKADVIDYILKPINMKELGETIKKVVHILDDESSQKKRIYDMNIKLIQSMPLLKEKFFIELIRDGAGNGQELKKRLEFLELDLPVEAAYLVFTITIDDRATVLESISERDRQLNSYALLNICQELIDRYFTGFSFEIRQGEYVCLINLKSEEDEEILYNVIDEIKDNLMKFLGMSLTIGVGQKTDSLRKVSQSYTMASEAASMKLLLGKNRVITINSLEPAEDDTFKFDFSMQEKLFTVLKAGDEEKLVSILTTTFEELFNSRNINIKYCQNICCQLLLAPARLLMELGLYTNELNVSENNLLERLFKQETLEDMKALLTTHYRSVCSFIAEKRNRKSRNVIEQVKDIINRRFRENLSVADIAKEVYLTSTYICLIFKQETGETVNEYMTKVRMEKAKELLKDTRNKFYDICYAVGYSDPSYFSKQFKKCTGLSPSEYREKVI